MRRLTRPRPKVTPFLTTLIKTDFVQQQPLIPPSLGSNSRVLEGHLLLVW